MGFSEACLSELGFAKSNPEGRSSQFLFNSNFSYELAIGSVFDLSPLEAQIKGYMDLQILNCQVLFCEMKTSTGSGVSEADHRIMGQLCISGSSITSLDAVLNTAHPGADPPSCSSFGQAEDRT